FWMQTGWRRNAMQRRAGSQQCATRLWSWDSSPSLARGIRSQKTPRYSWTGPLPLASPASTNSWQLRNSWSWCSAIRPARRGGSEGLANVAPDNPIWIRFARAMGPFMAPDAEMVAEHASDPAPKKVLDIAASHGLYGIAFGRRFPECHVTG